MVFRSHFQTCVFMLSTLWLGCFCNTSAVQAGVLFSAPATPYRSFADSPFASQLASSDYFYLETFEDGALNTPGIRDNTSDVTSGSLYTQPDGTVIQLGGVYVLGIRGKVRGPSPYTDSVDLDDGSFDGSGQQGHSYHQNFGATAVNDFSITTTSKVDFDFNQSELGSLPNAFGFAWTDGPFASTLRVTTTDSSGTVRTYIPTEADPLFGTFFGDSERDGGTQEDRFIEITSPTDIQSVSIINVSTVPIFFNGTTQVNNPDLSTSLDPELVDIQVVKIDPGFEIDHLQYGRFGSGGGLAGAAVPEPTTVSIFAIGSVLLNLRPRRALRGRGKLR